MTHTKENIDFTFALVCWAQEFVTLIPRDIDFPQGSYGTAFPVGKLLPCVCQRNEDAHFECVQYSTFLVNIKSPGFQHAKIRLTFLVPKLLTLCHCDCKSLLKVIIWGERSVIIHVTVEGCAISKCFPLDEHLEMIVQFKFSSHFDKAELDTSHHSDFYTCDCLVAHGGKTKTFLQHFFYFPFRLLLSAHHQPQNVTTAHPSSPHPSREKCPEIELLRWKSPIQQMTVRSSSEMMMVEVRKVLTAKQTCLESAQSCEKGSQCRVFKEGLQGGNTRAPHGASASLKMRFFTGLSISLKAGAHKSWICWNLFLLYGPIWEKLEQLRSSPFPRCHSL